MEKKEKWGPKTITSIPQEEIDDVIQNGLPEKEKRKLRETGINVE